MRLREFFVLLATIGFVASTNAQQWEWVQRFAGSNSVATTLALDAADNVYVAGNFYGTNIVGTNVFVAAGGSDVFVAKLSPTGSVLWATAAGGTNNDAIYRIAVSSNGSVFVAGRFDLSGTPTDRPVLAARVDEGVFTWTDRFAIETNASLAGVALGPDESPWVVGSTDRVFIRRYSRDGTSSKTFLVGNTAFAPTGITVNNSGQPYIRAYFSGTVDLGTTNLTSQWSIEHLTAALTETGTVRWAWVKHRFYSSYEPLTDIAATPDGGVVSVGAWDTGLPQGYGMVIRHAADGTITWRVDRTGHHKSVYAAMAVSVDPEGYIHLAGNAFAAVYQNNYRRSIWCFVLAPTGEQVSEQFITTAHPPDGNFATGVAASGRGDIYLAGQLSGSPMFGTNVMGAGLGNGNAFVARRATLTPKLDIRRSSTNVLLNWPRTSMPFELQNAELTSGNWARITNPPVQSTSGSTFSASADAPQTYFRLRMTNEVPINYPPDWQGFFLSVNRYPFLGRDPVLVTVSNQISNAYLTAFYGDANNPFSLAIEWRRASDNFLLTDGPVGTGSYHDAYGESHTYFYLRLSNPLLAAESTNAFLAVASDGSWRVTNSVTVEVLSATNAVLQLRQATIAAVEEPEQSSLVDLLDTASEALSAADGSLARAKLEEYRANLESNTSAAGMMLSIAALNILISVPSS